MDFLNIYSSNLIKNADGIWTNLNNPVKNGQIPIFYPSDGNKVLNGIEDNSFWFHHRNRVISSLVSSFSSNNKVFVEIGAGNGFVSRSLQQNGFTVIAVEPDRTGAQNCLEKNLNYVICSRFDDIQFKENSIENAGLFDVLEHISDPVPFLNKIRITMKKDSLLYITVPSYKFLYSSWDKQSGHFRRYTIKSLKKELQLAGFSVKFSTYFFSLFVLPLFLIRTIPHLFVKTEKDIWKNSTLKTHQKCAKNQNFMIQLQKPELLLLKRKLSIPFGTSCMVIACPK